MTPVIIKPPTHKELAKIPQTAKNVKRKRKIVSAVFKGIEILLFIAPFAFLAWIYF